MGAHGDAEFALLPINVFLEDSAAHVGGRVNVGWDNRLAHDEAYSLGHLLVKETSHALVVNAVTFRILLIPERNPSRSN